MISPGGKTSLVLSVVARLRCPDGLSKSDSMAWPPTIAAWADPDVITLGE
jgi:hypothetical protein